MGEVRGATELPFCDGCGRTISYSAGYLLSTPKAKHGACVTVDRACGPQCAEDLDLARKDLLMAPNKEWRFVHG